MPLHPDVTVESLNRRTGDNLPGWFGLEVVDVDEGWLAMEVVIKPQFLAAVIALADTAAGYATIAHLPDGAASFTTIELKSNFLATAVSGTLRAEASVEHQGRTTQVWDVKVMHTDTGKTIALFRCSQMVLWPKK